MAKNHPKDSVEPQTGKPPSKRTKSSSKRAAKKSTKKTDLVDQDLYKIMSRKLYHMTPLERKFGDAYVDNIGTISARNDEDYAIAVAIHIGIENYNAKGWSKSALKEPCVQHYINNKSRSQIQAQGITKERILAEYARIAFADIGEVVEFKDGRVKVKPFEEMGEDARRGVSSIQETVGEKSTTIKITQHDKMKALEMLAKHEGLVDEDRNDETPAEIAIKAIAAAQEMARITGGE